MTDAERIAYLEAMVATLQRTVEVQAEALRAASRRIEAEGEAARLLTERGEAARVKKAKQRADRSSALSRDAARCVPGQLGDGAGTAPSLPSPPFFLPSLPDPISPPPISSPSTLSPLEKQEPPGPVLAVVDGPSPEDLREVWNSLVVEGRRLPRWLAMSDARMRMARARLREEPRLEVWGRYLAAQMRSPGLREADGSWKGWVSPEWLLRAERVAQVVDHSAEPAVGQGSILATLTEVVGAR
jgi:hypothetical protein